MGQLKRDRTFTPGMVRLTWTNHGGKADHSMFFICVNLFYLETSEAASEIRKRERKRKGQLD